MSCNRCADQAEAAMQAAGVPARQTQATWASDESHPQCPACGAFLTRQGQCVDHTCDQYLVTRTYSGDSKAAPGGTWRPSLLPTLTSLNFDEMSPEAVKQIKHELDNVQQVGMNAVHKVIAQTWAMKAEFDAEYPEYKSEFVMFVGRHRFTVSESSGPPEADKAYRRWRDEKNRLMKNIVLAVQGRWRHQLKHLFPLEADRRFDYKYRLIGTDITVSVGKRTYKGQTGVSVDRGDEGLESFSTQMGKSGGWLESLRRLTRRSLGEETDLGDTV